MALNDPRPDIKPEFIACLIDISHLCTPELLARCGGKLFYSGFFDDSVNVHICSFTPSVYVDVIELVAEKYPEDEATREALYEELRREHTIDDNGYYNRGDIERMKRHNPDHFKVLGLTFDEDDDPDDVVREHLQGNPCF
jgi:hypothetical protein